ncbi:MAG TPA: lipase family protein [Baekduia sp.]|uniref:lipase family protein n=1 Tax=Baekduia sp. TaxID=2600305 RepID=UPI002D78B5F2|nr:lipase family protein [Baekduia sp.]HET6507704.1 lipase family protein [Baekduia sp.]
MSRSSRLVAVVAALALVLSVAAATTASAKVRTGPAGLAFYTPPKPLPGHRHGDAIWAKAAHGGVVVPGSSATELVLYRSQDAHGANVPVSGVISIPKGRAPRGGWPVITWAHGTTGIADACAPSRDDGRPAHAYNSYVYPLLSSWLKAGYAVVRTDYEGLGTPYDHQYLNGRAEGSGVLDIVRAARQVDPRLSKNIIISGHSQGGHAALFAAALASRYTPELKVKGTVAFAPASHLDEQIPLTTGLTTPNPGLSALIATIGYGLHAAYPDRVDLASFLSPEGVQLALKTQSTCLSQLTADAQGVAPAALFQPGADLGPIARLLDLNDPSHLVIRTPVLLEQGTADTTVFPVFTDQLASELRHNGTDGRLYYRKLDGVDHGGIVVAGAKPATTWIEQRLPG